MDEVKHLLAVTVLKLTLITRVINWLLQLRTVDELSLQLNCDHQDFHNIYKMTDIFHSYIVRGMQEPEIKPNVSL